MALVVTVVVVALAPSPQSVASVAERAWCLVTSPGRDGAADCEEAVLAGTGPGEQPSGPDGGPADPPATPEGEPEDVPDPEEVPPPDPENPDDPACRDVLPTSGPLDADDPTRVRVGCRELFAPEQCQSEWDVYTAADEGRDRGDAARPLAACIEEAYASMEPPCVTAAETTVERSEMRFLFVRFGSSRGMLVEHLGDGRARIHLVEGAETGGGASGGVGSFSFDVAGLSGWSTDTTYEFADLEGAQEWVDWYRSYGALSASYERLGNVRCRQFCSGVYKTRKEVEERLDETIANEALHHELASAEADTRKVTLSGGVDLPLTKKGSKGEGSGTLGISGDYTGEIVVEDRHWNDGTQTVTYSSSDAGGFLVAASLGGKGLSKRDEKDKGRGGGGSGHAGGGATFSGKTSTTVVWGPDGDLSKLLVAVDDQVLDELFDAGVDLEATLPYGFGVSGGYSRTQKEGEASVTELVLDFEQFPELREELGPRIDELFPRDDDGDLRRDDVTIDVDEMTEDGGRVHDVLAESANVRRLDYDVAEVEEAGEVGVDWQGIDLFKASWTTVESERTLSSSSFEITDVEGERQRVTPTPRCEDEPFEAPDGYYTQDFSDPPAVPIVPV